MKRVFNFSAGPATLPTETLQIAQRELLNWHDTGMSIMEMSHRGADFMSVAEQAEQDFRDLLQIPSNYHVLFLQGGARSQFAMVPLNLLGEKGSADYLDTGIWSELAIKEAQRYCHVNVVASSKADNYTTIPEPETWRIQKDAAYLHYVDNETINGVEFPAIPDTEATLVADMSSNLLSRPIDIERFGVIYAGAQKNVGPAGLTIVIVKDDLIGHELTYTPSMFSYKLHATNNSMYNTPPTFAWYMAGLVFQWLKQQGGVAAIAAQNLRKAQKLYQYIDSQDFYINPIAKKYRSRMNVVFSLTKSQLNEIFLQEAKEVGLVNLKGHKLVGGMRASIYNAFPEEGVDSLIHFMNDFSKRHH